MRKSSYKQFPKQITFRGRVCKIPPDPKTIEAPDLGRYLKELSNCSKVFYKKFVKIHSLVCKYSNEVTRLGISVKNDLADNYKLYSTQVNNYVFISIIRAIRYQLVIPLLITQGYMPESIMIIKGLFELYHASRYIVYGKVGKVEERISEVSTQKINKKEIRDKSCEIEPGISAEIAEIQYNMLNQYSHNDPLGFDNLFLRKDLKSLKVDLKSLNRDKAFLLFSSELSFRTIINFSNAFKTEILLLIQQTRLLKLKYRIMKKINEAKDMESLFWLAGVK